MTKKCITCKVEKSLDKFHRQYNAPDGRRYDCKDCHILYQKTFRRGTGYEQSWRKRDWEGYLVKVKEYRRTSGGYYASFKNRKYPLEFTRKEFIEWDSKQQRICFYCSISEETMLKLPEFCRKRGQGNFYRLTIDRKDNKKFYSLENIVLACPRCNETKGDFFRAEEFKDLAENYIKPKWKKLMKVSGTLKLGDQSLIGSYFV